jgi:hypothetical protein
MTLFNLRCWIKRKSFNIDVILICFTIFYTHCKSWYDSKWSTETENNGPEYITECVKNTWQSQFRIPQTRFSADMGIRWLFRDEDKKDYLSCVESHHPRVKVKCGLGTERESVVGESVGSSSRQNGLIVWEEQLLSSWENSTRTVPAVGSSGKLKPYHPPTHSWTRNCCSSELHASAVLSWVKDPPPP